MKKPDVQDEPEVLVLGDLSQEEIVDRLSEMVTAQMAVDDSYYSQLYGTLDDFRGLGYKPVLVALLDPTGAFKALAVEGLDVLDFLRFACTEVSGDTSKVGKVRGH